MSEKKFSSIAEIDEALEKAFENAEKAANLEDTVDNEEVEETEEVKEAAPVKEEPTLQETTEEQSLETKEAKPEEKPKVEEKAAVVAPSSEEKTAYAFKQLREEVSSAKQKAAELEASLSELNRLAQSKGFKDHQDFLDYWKEQQLKEDAAKQNIDPKLLKELQDTKTRLAKLETERNAETRNLKIEKIGLTIDKFASTHKLSENEIQNILGKMGTDNISVDMLVSSPIETVEKLLKGYAQDILVERKVQEKLASLQTAETPPEKHKSTTTSKKPEPFSKEALESEMESFKKNNFPWLK